MKPENGEVAMAARILSTARERLLDIWEYTCLNWGEEQADLYLRALLTHIESLGERTYSWKPVPYPECKGACFARHEHHYVFFRVLGNGDIGVITVLHGKMDLPVRFIEDLAETTAESEDPPT